MRPAHDFVMASEHVELARIHRALREVPSRYLVAVKTDCLVFQNLPRKFLKDVEALARRRHRDCTPKYRFEEVKRLERQYSEPRMEAEPPASQELWREPAALGHAGYREDAPGEADRDAALGARRGRRADLEDALLRAEPRDGAQTADRWARRTIRAGRCSLDWLIAEEVTQLDVGLWADIAQLSTNPQVRFLLLGDFRQLPAVQDSFDGAPVLRSLKESQLLHDLAGGFVHELTENQRSDEKIFRFLEWLRVDEPEQAELRDAVQRARKLFPRRGHPDTCLVISHADRIAINDRENRRLAPEGAVLVEHRGSGPAGTSQQGCGSLAPERRLPRASSSRSAKSGSGSCLTTVRASRPPSFCGTRGSATPSPTRAARGSRCAGGFISATPTTRTFP